MNIRLVLVLLIFLEIPLASAQLRISDTEDISTIVKRLEGPGVKIFNITHRFSPNAQLRPAGSFIDDFGFTGLDRGLLLTSGAAINALGPNNMPGITQINNDTMQDPDLIPFIKDYDKDEKRMNDVCYVEFDLVSSYPILSFNYVFASEEYIEFLNYYDVFTFLISGPGIAGKKNIAVLPNTSIPVSVATVNPNQNSGYYLSNGTGSTPYINIDFQYDGYTKVLEAKTNIIPCEVYHIKLAIADVLDDTYDAAVFIEEGSFQSQNLDLKVMYEHPRFNTAMEGCNDAYVVFRRPWYAPFNEDVTFEYTIHGTAQNDMDYSHIEENIIIPAGKDSAYVVISPTDDLISDNSEFVRLVIKSKCSFFSSLDSIEIPIRETFSYTIPDEKICKAESVRLNKSFIPGDSIFWDATPFLDCHKCPSPSASVPFTSYLLYTAKDTASGCVARDSVKVEVIKVKADFEYYHDPCYSSLDFLFNNKSEQATYYSWSFGDGKETDEENPRHQYPFYNTLEPQQYAVTLVAASQTPNCAADTTIYIEIDSPLFIPNLITDNSDAKNDVMQIVGIVPGCWTLEIYNRWGNLMYKNDNYQNDFTGKDLNGVYYFVLRNGPEDREYKGWINIIN